MVIRKWNKTHNCYSWYFRAYYRDKNGFLKRVAHKVGLEPVITRSDALRAERIFLGNVARGNWFEEEKKIKRLFKDSAVQFLDKYSKPKKKSCDKDEQRINNLNRFFGNRYIDEINTFMVQRYQADRVKEVKGSTVNRELSLMRNIYNRFIDWGWVVVNPIKGIKFFEEEGRCRYLSPEELKVFFIELELLSSYLPYLKSIVMLAVSTGMRESEIFNLKHTQINRVVNQITLEDTKSGGRQTIRLNETALEVLNSVKKKGDYVFYNTKGRRLKGFGRCWYKLLRKAGIKDFRFHDLRHCFASYLSMLGANQLDLKAAMRHKSLAMTERYVHLMPSHQDKVVKKLDGFLDTYIDTQDKEKGKLISLKR